MALPNNVFTGYSPTQLRKLAQSYGYNETNLDNFGKFLEENPSRAKQYFDQQNMDMFGPDKMRQFQQGGTTTEEPQIPKIAELTAQRVTQPQLPVGGAFQAVATPFQQAQLIDPIVGQATAVQIPQATQVDPAVAAAPTQAAVPTVTAAAAAPAIQALPGTAQALEAPTQTVEAAQQAESQLANLQAAQAAQAAQVQAPTARTLQAGEQIALPTGQAAQAATFVAPTAVTAAPTEAATVQGQLTTLLQQFEEGEVPTWAKGAVRAAQQTLLTRGLGASSIAGQAVVQAAMEASLPIAQMDAATVAKFEAQNLSNRQQTAMEAARYRATFLGQEFDQAFQTRVQNAAKIADIANRNFTAEQTIALENSRLVQTTNLANLNNKQALILAQASALANLDIANLNNRQQAATQNSQQFLQLDLQNLNNAQQSAVLNSQQQVQALLTDTAAENVARQINAKSQMQVDQFYDNLISDIALRNANAINAANQFNAGEVNAIQKLNAQFVNQMQQSNARNQIQIAQSNALWRREIATADTAAANFQNQTNAQNLVNMSEVAYNNLQQEYRDVMEWAWTSGENALERFTKLEEAQIQASTSLNVAEYNARKNAVAGLGGFFGKLVMPIVSGIFGLGD
jgi:hypothetical protein|tara:strand:+ start:8581 stop:10464 length:1884 start_codon:yes stop_codon:yes gene_type:complete